MSRAALARKAGLHQTYIGLLEREERSPNLETAQAIAKALHFTLTEMIAEAENFRLIERTAKNEVTKRGQHRNKV